MKWADRMIPPTESEPAADSLESVLAARLADYDEALRSRVGPLPVEDGSDLSPDARERLRRAQSSLRLLNQARPTTERSPTAVPRPFHATPTVASAAELQATELLRRRLRVGYLCSAITFVYTLFVCRSGLYEMLIGPVGAFITHGVLGQTGELLAGLSAAATGASAALLWTRQPFSYRQLRRLEVGIYAIIILMTAYWQFRFQSVQPADGFDSAAHQDTWILYGTTVGLVIWVIVMVVQGLYVPQTPWRCAAAMAGSITAAVAATLAAAWAKPAVAAITAVLIGEILLVLGLVAALCVFSTVQLRALEHEARVARQEARELGQYRLGELLGRGGMGVVYRAEHRLLKRPCAVKLIRPDRAGDTATLARFEREVQASAALRHPNVVEIYDYGRGDDGTFYYVMEFLPGLTLEQLVRRHGPLPAPRGIHLLRQLCGALRAAHAAGLIHRDIKPGNVQVCDREPADLAKLLDFGLVRSASADDLVPGPTRDGCLVGTPGYMAPEQITTGAVDQRSDLYSLGAVAYFLLTGHAPFESGTVMETLAAQMRDSPQPLSHWCPTLSADLEAIVLRCLSPKAADRYASAADLDRALAGCGDTWTEDAAAAWWSNR